MKKRLLLVAIIVLIVASVFCGCDDPNKPPQATLSVRSPYDTQGVSVYEEEINTYDYAKLFLLRSDSQEYTVEQSYLDTSGLTADGGVVVCTYGEQTAQVTVKVIRRMYELTLLQSYVTLRVPEVADYDFKPLFLAKIDGAKADIADDMVTSNVKAVAGNYQYTVDFHCVKQTLNVQVLDEVVIKPIKDNYYSLNEIDVDTYDFTKLFTIIVNGVEVEVKKEYIDASQATNDASFTVYCKYGTAESSLYVVLPTKIYTVSLSNNSVLLYVSKVDGYNFNKLFTVTLNSRTIDITDEMVTSNVKAQVGKYTYTVTAGKESKTLNVEVTDIHQVEVVLNYPNLELELANAPSFDCTRLFALYVDGDAVKVTKDMLDVDSLQSFEIGKTYEVTLTYTDADGKVTTKKATVSVVETAQISIVGKNIVTYPNSAPIDLKTLFTITRGDEVIPVTDGMITGSVNYGAAGDNVITLEYNGVSQTATVTVQRGLVINTKADVITVKQGTDIEKYFFENDFEVIVNGVKIDYIIPYLDISNLDFTTIGQYAAVLTVPYGDKPTSGLSSTSQLQNYTAQIVYKVESNTYSIAVKENSVIVTKNEAFNPFSNIAVTVDGRSQTLTSNPNHVDAISCYAKVVNGVDSSKIGTQIVTVEVYANGPDNEPQTVSYRVDVLTDITIEARDKAVFTGAAIYTRDLFTIKRGNTAIPVTDDMVSGHVDVFTPGNYVVEIAYEGITRQATVTVVDAAVKGTYSTLMTTVAGEDDEDEEGWITEGEKSRVYGDMVIDEDFNVKMDDKTGSFAGLDADGNLTFMMATTRYTMYYYDGIVVMDPDNSLNMSYNNNRRPMVYINNALWRFNNNGKIILNSSKSGVHVVGQDSSSIYTIEIFRVTSRANSSVKVNFALKVHLLSRLTSGHYYNVSWGEATFNEGFTQANGEKGTLYYAFDSYNFVMHGPVSARLEEVSDTIPFAGTTFRRTANNSKDTLFIGSNGQITYKVDNKNVFTPVTRAEVDQMKNGGINVADNTIFVYEHDGYGYDKEWFSYKFKVNETTGLYELLPKDNLYGLYVCDKVYVFLDGYGTGVISLNSNGYNEYQLTYELVGNEIVLTFVNVIGNKELGKTATFYLADTLNVLTCKESNVTSLVGKRLLNKHISDGAIITVDQTYLHSGSTSDDVVNAITVITGNGEMTAAEKKASISRTIGYNQAGVYQYTITIPLGGATYNAYFGVQVATPLDPTPALAGKYNSVINSGYVLELDNYGIATLRYDGKTLVGNVQYYGDDRFVARVKNGADQAVIAGELFADGTLVATCSGAVNFTDYLTQGTSAVAGDNNCALRRITVNGNNVYVWCKTTVNTGEKVTVNLLGGNQYVVSTSDGEVIVRIDSWSSVKEGLVLQDGVRGTYTRDNDQMFLDGFGSVTLNGQYGSYRLNANKTVTAEINGKVAVYTLNVNEATYAIYDIALDNSLMQGVRLSATFNFICEDDMYSATTLFVFGADGVVTVYSSSAEHDSGDNQCTVDKYSPDYASAKGSVGSFQVNGDKVTVTVNSCQFAFQIADVTNVNKMTCLSTSVDSEAHGYFPVGTLFAIPVTD